MDIHVLVCKLIQSSGQYDTYQPGSQGYVDAIRLRQGGQYGTVLFDLSLDGLTQSEAEALIYSDKPTTVRPYIDEGIPNGAAPAEVVWDGSGVRPKWLFEQFGKNTCVAFPLTAAQYQTLRDLFLQEITITVEILGDSQVTKYYQFAFWVGYSDGGRSQVLYEATNTLPEFLTYYVPMVMVDYPIPELVYNPPPLDPIDFAWGLDRNILNRKRLLFVEATEGLSGDYTRRVLIGHDRDTLAEVDESLLERMHIPFPRGDVMDWESRKQISYVAPKCRKAGPEFYVDLWLGTQEDIDSPIVWHGPKRWRTGKKGVFFDKSGRFISLRARLPVDSDFRLTGYDIEYKLVSKR